MQMPEELFIDGIHPAVEKLSFAALNFKLSKSSESTMPEDLCKFAEEEYKRFLTLKKFYPGKELVPNKLVDDYWHAHILDTAAYEKDCQSVFGYFLHHYPYLGIYGDEDSRALMSKFKDTINLYEQHFGTYPFPDELAARCQDHKCHVPSECRCRAPGACK